MYTRAENELTFTLLTELLAFQFCSPVQWIETQNTLFRGPDRAERFIEFGPSSTLVDMAKKTLVEQAVVSGAPGDRELLSYQNDNEAIYYRRYESGDKGGAAPLAASDTVPTVPREVPSASMAMDAPITVTTTQDVPLDPIDVVLTITCLALKKSPQQVSLDHPLKNLCGGRSTLQNELIGDLMAEFSHLPDQPEQLSITELAESVTLANGRPGSYITARTAKFASAKMPSAYPLSNLRKHLKDSWGLGQGLQDRILLTALLEQPSCRITNEVDCKSFFDDIAIRVTRSLGLDLTTTRPADNFRESGTAMISPEALQRFERKNNKFYSKLASLYYKESGNKGELPGQIEALRQTVGRLQSDIDMWLSEHGQFYADNMRPKFDSQMARIYDSSWNWVVQDFFVLWANIVKMNGPLDTNTRSVLLLLARITPRLLSVMDYVRHKLQRQSPGKRTHLIEILSELSGAAARGIASPPSLPIPKVFTRSLSLSGMKCHISDDMELEENSGYMSGSEEHSLGTPLSERSRVMTPYSKAISFEFINLVSFTNAYLPQVKSRVTSGEWRKNEALTDVLAASMQRCMDEGISFQNKTVLVTGAGKGSIAFSLVKLLICGGARVIVTTSSYTSSVSMWQKTFAQYGGRGSQLRVVPFNGGSHQDIRNLADYVYVQLGLDLDHVIPFAALGETGRMIDNIDSTSELAHRAMLTNVVRLLGAIKTCKEKRRLHSRPTQVILPLSPNHGIMGNDGLYAESKLGLEALLSKRESEDWNDYLDICGVVIGWTRGTGLMAANDAFASRLEAECGLQTFSTDEMAGYIACLMGDETIRDSNEIEPLIADTSGDMSIVQNLKTKMLKIKEDIETKNEMVSALARENASKENGSTPHHQSQALRPNTRRRIANLDSFSLPDYEETIQPLAEKLEGMIDLDKVPVVVGYGEIGPYGNSRTRWEAELDGTLSLQGCLELAWMMGLVRYHNGPHPLGGQNQHYCGWIETSSKMPITEAELKTKYEEQILAHSGIRILEPKDYDETADASRQRLLHAVALEEDLGPFEVTPQTAEELRMAHGDKVELYESQQQMFAKLKAGLTLMVPKSVRVRNGVGAQIPDGWDARRYGISEEIIHQVDPVTLFALVSTTEALISAGLTDPFELYDHVHISDVSICLGSGLGGTTSLRSMFKERFKDQVAVPKDVLAETFINTTGAWVNMLLLGASGPNRTPVGACATALESVDTGVDLITSGRAKVCIVGGFDALELDVATEFGNLQATVDAAKEAAMGRSPREMSRPTTSSRSGFVEAEGSGVQVMTSARLALDMGLPIHAVVALCHTASDGVGRSVPAPGKGLLTIVKETKSEHRSPALLDIDYRRARFERRKQQLAEDSIEAEALTSTEAQMQAKMELESALKQAQSMYGNDFFKADSRISPLQGALAVWGLTVDDIGFASLHGTSTAKNDLNEASVLQKQMALLGRSKGNVIPCICQKWLTGHAKGAAGAFALNGCIQSMSTGVVPGNRNADNIDADLEASDMLVFPQENIDLQTFLGSPVDAFSVTSFGFGQKGAQVIGVHPRRLFATVSKVEYNNYRSLVMERRRRAWKYLQDGMCSGNMVRLKDKGVRPDGMEDFYVKPDARRDDRSLQR